MIFSKESRILMLIDGNALIHRSYHGIPPLKTKKGLLVNAIYGFTSSILAAIKEFHPEYLAVAFDVGKITFRNKQYKEYKAHRVKMEDDLAAQFPLVHQITKALNFPEFGIKNYEADDVIGTITHKIQDTRNKLQTIIVTGDMDTLQLVNENTFVYSVARGVKRAELFDREKVVEKYGFGPEMLTDYKGLRGDPSDNIPGVPGVGEKTATNLIKQFGDLDKLYAQISKSKIQITNKIQNPKDQISKRIIAQLIKYKDQAYLSKKLATIYDKTPLDFRLSDAKIAHYDPELAKKVFLEFEFKSLIPKLPSAKEAVEQTKLF